MTLDQVIKYAEELRVVESRYKFGGGFWGTNGSGIYIVLEPKKNVKVTINQKSSFFEGIKYNLFLTYNGSSFSLKNENGKIERLFKTKEKEYQTQLQKESNEYKKKLKEIIIK